MMRKVFGAATAVVFAACLAGCDPSQEAAVNSVLSNICGDLALGTQIVVDVAANGSKVGTVAGQVATVGEKVCPTLISQVQGLVAQSTSAGRTATLDVTTTTPSATPGAASVVRHGKMKLRRRLNSPGEAGPHYVIVLAPKTFLGIPLPTGL